MVGAPAAATQRQVVRPMLGKPAGVPARPAAGRRFTLSLPVTRSDTGRPLLTGTIACHASVAGKVVRHVQSFTAGRARLSLVVPKTAKGKLLKVGVRVTAWGRTAVRTHAYAVR